MTDMQRLLNEVEEMREENRKLCNRNAELTNKKAKLEAEKENLQQEVARLTQKNVALEMIQKQQRGEICKYLEGLSRDVGGLRKILENTEK